jgi:ribosome-binding factor A
MEETVVQRKTAEMIRRELSEILSREVVVRPGTLLTVSLVRVTGDLSIVKVYVTLLPETGLNQVVDALNEKTWEIRNLLAPRIRNKMRKMPELRFFADDSLQEAMAMEKLFERIKQEDKEKQPGEQATTESL